MPKPLQTTKGVADFGISHAALENLSDIRFVWMGTRRDIGKPDRSWKQPRQKAHLLF